MTDQAYLHVIIEIHISYRMYYSIQNIMHSMHFTDAETGTSHFLPYAKLGINVKIPYISFINLKLHISIIFTTVHYCFLHFTLQET